MTSRVERPPTILLPSFRRIADEHTWDDLYLAVASARYYASECPLFVGWDGPFAPVFPVRAATLRRDGPFASVFPVRAATLRCETRPSGLTGPAAYNWCAAEASTAEHVILMNDDAMFHPETVSRLIEDWNTLVAAGHRVGFLGCRSNFVAGEANIRSPNGGTRTGVTFTSEEEVLAVSTVYPVCALIERNVFLDAGGFSTAITWYADNLLCFDLAVKSYRHFVSRAYVHHVGMRGTHAEAGRSMAQENARSLAWLRVHRPDYLAYRHACRKEAR